MIKPTSNMDNSYKNSLSDNSLTDMDCVNDSTVSTHEDHFNTRLSSQMWAKIVNDHETTIAETSTQTEELDIIAHLRTMHRFIQKRIPKKSVGTQTSPNKEENYDYRPKKSQKSDDFGDICDNLFEMPIFPKVKKSIRQRLSELKDFN